MEKSLVVSGPISTTKIVAPNIASMTVCHLAPIEGDITFKIGSPVFFSGKVYKQNNEKWELSTTSDRTDCICSVINVGNHKTFAGVVVSIDESKNSLTFASHGDFMFNVEDTTLYEVGVTWKR